jgi:glycosyltransferase involved in cell wall biosynthesis
MSKRVFYDGVNLSLKRGTGIATYTRVLGNIAHDLGHRTGILYSRPYPLPREHRLREILFFDADMGGPLPLAVRAARMVSKILPAVGGVRPKEISLSENVIKAPLGSAWVPADEVYSALQIFDRSRSSFALTGMFPKVRFAPRPDLFHWTFPIPMRSNARANIYTIHDLIPLRLPYTGLDWKRFYYRALKKLVAKADHIVTVSEHSKRDIMTFFGVEENRITNTYAATDIPRKYAARSDDVIANELAGMFGLDLRNYVLYYGSLEPKKNVGRIIQAYLAANVPLPLVVVSARSWLAEDETLLLNQIIEQQKNERTPHKRKRIHVYEYIPFRFLTSLIAGARVVLFPSLYEGFGLPLLEGMMLGTPVISSTTSSMPEVAGDAALLVDPHNVDAIKDAIITVCNDADMRAELRARGLKRAELFSLDAYRERVGKLYAALI